MNDKDFQDLWKKMDKGDNPVNYPRSGESSGFDLAGIQQDIRKMRFPKSIAVLTGIVWCLVVGALVVMAIIGRINGNGISWFFIISMGLQVLLTALGTGMYMHQVILLQQMELAGTVVETQERISRILMSGLWSVRILILQLPLWSTFFLSRKMLAGAPMHWLLFQAVVTAGLSVITLWLFRQLRFENRHKRWFRFLFSGKGWTPLMKAMDNFEELQQFGK